MLTATSTMVATPSPMTFEQGQQQRFPCAVSASVGAANALPKTSREPHQQPFATTPAAAGIAFAPMTPLLQTHVVYTMVPGSFVPHPILTLQTQPQAVVAQHPCPLQACQQEQQVVGHGQAPNTASLDRLQSPSMPLPHHVNLHRNRDVVDAGLIDETCQQQAFNDASLLNPGKLATNKDMVPTSHVPQAKDMVAFPVHPYPILTSHTVPRFSGPVRVTLRQVRQAPATEMRRICQQLDEWEPFYPVEYLVGSGVTSAVQETEPFSTAIHTASIHHFDLTGAWPYFQQTDKYQFILFMIPWTATAAQSGSKGHLWPKGTAVHVNRARMKIVQRKQQIANLAAWKGPCSPLDLSSELKNNDLSKPLEVALTAYDKEVYACQLAVCRKVTPRSLYTNILNEKSIFLGRPACLMKAVDIAKESQPICCDDDDATVGKLMNNASSALELGKFTFSLLCPLTKKPIVSPVRGKHCRHWQVSELCACPTHVLTDFVVPTSALIWRIF